MAIFAGNCLYIDKRDKVIETAVALKGIADVFRVKLWGGGTTPEKYRKGIGYKGINDLRYINSEIMKVATECQTPHQVDCCNLKIDWAWVGCRSAQNYGLLKDVARFEGNVIIKRNYGQTIDEVIGLFDIMKKIHKKEVYICERGINTFDRKDWSRWSPDLKGVIRIKHERPDIFKRLIVDCSHSVFVKEWVEDVYKAFKAVGVKSFMFEVTIDGKSRTDQSHILSVKELKKIIGKE